MGGAGAGVVGCDAERDYGRRNGYGGGHPGERLLDILHCLGECGVGGNEALNGGIGELPAVIGLR